MGTKYTTQATSGYNASPPPDDGTQVAANLITWAGVKTKLADVLKTFGEAINTALVSALDLSARAISTPDTAVASDHWKTLQVTGTTTITLSSAASMGAGYEVGIFNAGVGVVTVTPGAAADTINGVSASVTVPIKGTIIFRTNQGLTGYNIVAQSNSGQTLTASTSVITPQVGGAAGATLGLLANAGVKWLVDDGPAAIYPNVTGTSNLGSTTKVILNVFTGIIDTGTTGSGALKTNNGTTVLTWANDLSITLAGKLTANAAGNVIAPSFESAETAVNGGGTGSTTTIAHGLSTVPRLYSVVMRNKTTEFGYAVGDEVLLATGASVTTTTYADATNVGIVIANGFAAPSVVRRDTFAAAVVTAANWKYVVRAWK